MTKYLTIILLLISQTVFSQGYKFQLNLESAVNKEVYLAHYYIGDIYVDDTIKLNDAGSGILKGDNLLPQGLYKIYMDDKNHFDFLLGADQEFSISNKTFSGETIEIKGSVESEEFVKYMSFLENLKENSARIRNSLKTANQEEKRALQKELSLLTPQLQGYWKRIDKELPNTFLAKFLMSNYIPKLDISTIPKETQQNDSLLLLARFKYQQKHFWDYLDYTDERFLYTPLLKPRLETWFTKVLYQNYDSIRPYVFEFIEKVRSNKRIFQFATSFFLNSSINSKVMGIDALFVDLARTYYLSGEAFWATEESLKKIKENVLFMENSLIGMVAPDLTLENIDGEFFNLHQIDKKLTAVIIYEPECSHCSEFVPQFYNEIYQKYKDKGLEVFAIYSMHNKEEWIKFIGQNNLWEWINVWDKDRVSGFNILYDARITPGIFILDEKKRIIAKKMTVKQLDKLIGFELN